MKNGFTDHMGHQKNSLWWILTEAEKTDLTEKPEKPESHMELYGCDCTVEELCVFLKKIIWSV